MVPLGPITMNNREKEKKEEMNAKNLLEGIGRNVGDVVNNIDLVIAENTQESQEHYNNNYKEMSLTRRICPSF